MNDNQSSNQFSSNQHETRAHFTSPLAENAASTCSTPRPALRHRDGLGVNLLGCLPKKIKTKCAHTELAWPTAAEPRTCALSARSASSGAVRKTNNGSSAPAGPLATQEYSHQRCDVVYRIILPFSFRQGKLIKSVAGPPRDVLVESTKYSSSSLLNTQSRAVMCRDIPPPRSRF